MKLDAELAQHGLAGQVDERPYVGRGCPADVDDEVAVLGRDQGATSPLALQAGSIDQSAGRGSGWIAENRTSSRVDLSRLVQMLKGGSSYAASRVPGNKLGLRWTREYSATTVSPRSLPQAVQYLREQNYRHPMERVADSIASLGRHSSE